MFEGAYECCELIVRGVLGGQEKFFDPGTQNAFTFQIAEHPVRHVRRLRAR